MVFPFRYKYIFSLQTANDYQCANYTERTGMGPLRETLSVDWHELFLGEFIYSKLFIKA